VGSPAPRAVLVDGYNVLHAIPRFAPRGGDLAAARDRFEAWLVQAAARSGVGECVLIWDGRGGQRQRRVGPVSVLYTAAGVSADDRLLDLCRGAYAARAASTWVVSSDHDVQRPARQLGFAVLGAMTFYRRWAPAAGPAATDPPGADRDRSTPGAPSRAEVDELLAEFLEADRGPR
jgi:predicted RNA-binding protein with PIN domain